MSETTKKFTQEEIDSLQEIQTEMDQIIIRFGQISINKEALNSQENQLKKLLQKNQLLKKLQLKKYQKVSLD